MSLYDKGRSAFLEGVCGQSFIFLLFSIAFIILGRITKGQIEQETVWDAGAWYQLHTGSYIAAVPMLLIFLVFSFISIAGKNDKEYNLKQKARNVRSVLFLGFVGLLISAVIVGNFVKESNVFTDCSNNDNSTEYYNRTMISCFVEYNLIRGLSSSDITLVIVSLILVIEEIIGRGHKDNAITSTSASTKATAMCNLWLKGLYFFAIGITLVTVGGISIVKINEESDTIEGSSHRLHLSAFLGGGAALPCCLFFWCIHDRVTKKSHIEGCLMCLTLVLYFAFAALVASLVNVSWFIHEYRDFIRCSNTTLLENKTSLFSCLENKKPLEDSCIACITMLVLCFLIVFGIYCSHFRCKKAESKPTRKKISKVKIEPKKQEQINNGTKSSQISEKTPIDSKNHLIDDKMAIFTVENDNYKKKTILNKETKDKTVKRVIRKTLSEGVKPYIVNSLDDVKKDTTKSIVTVSTATVAAKLKEENEKEREIHNTMRNEFEGSTGRKGSMRLLENQNQDFNIRVNDAMTYEYDLQHPSEGELVVTKSDLYDIHNPSQNDFLLTPPPVEIPDDVDVCSLKSHVSNDKLSCTSDGQNHIPEGQIRQISDESNTLSDQGLKMKTDDPSQISDPPSGEREDPTIKSVITSDILDGNTCTPDSNAGVTDVNTGITDEGTCKTKGNMSVIDDNTCITDNTTGITDENKDITDISTGVSDGNTGIANEASSTTVANTDITDITDNTTGITDGTTAITDENTDTTDNTTGITDGNTAITYDNTDITENTTVITDGNTALTNDNTDITENTTGITDGKTVITDDNRCIIDARIGITNDNAGIADDALSTAGANTNITDNTTGITDVNAVITDKTTFVTDGNADISDCNAGITDDIAGITNINTDITDEASSTSDRNTDISNGNTNITEDKAGITDGNIGIMDAKTDTTYGNTGTDRDTNTTCADTNITSGKIDIATDDTDINKYNAGHTESDTGHINNNADMTSGKTGITGGNTDLSDNCTEITSFT